MGEERSACPAVEIPQKQLQHFKVSSNTQRLPQARSFQPPRQPSPPQPSTPSPPSVHPTASKTNHLHVKYNNNPIHSVLLLEIHMSQPATNHKQEITPSISASEEASRRREIWETPLGRGEWSARQKASFVGFWLARFAREPFEESSFNAPLRRNDYFKQISQHIREELGEAEAMNAKQCKTRFSTIRRSINRSKQRNVLPRNYTFVDYIIQEATRLLPACPHLAAFIQTVSHMKNEESEFMRLTYESYRMERGCAVEEKNNKIYAYLNGKGLISWGRQ